MLHTPNLTGDYAADWPKIKEFFEGISTAIDIDNLDGEEITTTTDAAATDHVVNHKLGRVPRRFIVMTKDKLSDVRMVSGDKKTVTIEASVITTKVKFFLQ